MVFKYYSDTGSDLLVCGRKFATEAEAHATTKELSDAQKSMCLLAAILDRHNVTQDTLFRIARATERIEIHAQTSIAETIADARLKCWKTQRKPAMCEAVAATPIGEPISDEQWAELTPGVRNKLQTAGVTHFSQLYNNECRMLKGIGAVTADKVLCWCYMYSKPPETTE